MTQPMTQPVLIGLGGYATAGKDAVADYLVATYSFVKTYMSEPLERALLTLNPVIPVYPGNWIDRTWPKDAVGYESHMTYQHLHGLIGYDATKNNFECRRLLQVLGTDIGRKMFDEDIWVNLGFKTVDAALAEGKDVTITGIRFQNELDAVLERPNGVAVWVERPGRGPVNGHVSDNTLGPDDFEFAINNDGTLDDLYYKVYRLLDDLDANHLYSLNGYSA